MHGDLIASHQPYVILALGVLCLVPACKDTVAPPDSPDVGPWVTGAAAMAVGADGRFDLSAPSIGWPYDHISSSDAPRLALSLITTFADPDVPLGITLGQQLETQHGAPVDPERLKASDRVPFATSLYEPFPDSVPLTVRKWLGPIYLVRLSLDGWPAVSVGVSIFSTDLEIVDGQLHLPSSHGGEFDVQGITRGNRWMHPIGPEEAVVIAGEATGVRIKEVPRLVRPHKYFSMMFLRWKLVLERPVDFLVRATGERRRADTVYVGIRHDASALPRNYRALLLPRTHQPAADTVVDAMPETEEIKEYVLAYRAGAPVYLDDVVAAH